MLITRTEFSLRGSIRMHPHRHLQRPSGDPTLTMRTSTDFANAKVIDPISDALWTMLETTAPASTEAEFFFKTKTRSPSQTA